MERQNILFCLGLFVVASTVGVVVDPRGARPIEHGTKADKCDTQKEWPFCTDDDWGPKCPSGCRIQGLMDKYDHELLKKIEKIRALLADNQAKHRSADQDSKQTYDNLREKLILDAGNDNTYYDLAQNLRQRIVDMKIKIDRQLRTLGAMKDRVKDQVIQMQRLEVDIDMKLRSCKGSCQSYNEYSVDKDSYVALEKQVAQLDAQAAQSIETVSSMYVMKSRALKDVVVDTRYKAKQVVGAGDAGQTDDFFPDVKIVQLTLESEGASPSSPATVSKVPGTHFSTSSSSSSSSSSPSGLDRPSGGGSITLLSGGGGRGDGGDFLPGGLGGGFEAFTGGEPSTTHHVSTSTKTVSCTKTIRRTVVQTAEGPVERMEEVTEGGPECQIVGPSKGGPSSTSPFGSKTSFSTKGGFGEHFGGMDLGGFFTADPEEDVPDFKARSIHGARVERQADYVGKDCADIRQKHLDGEKSGLFNVKPGGPVHSEVVEVFCQQGGLMGGWLLVQQRESGALSFNRSWAEYRGGFGGVDARGKGEVWLGNRHLHLLTAGPEETMLRVELEDWEGGRASAEYTVRVGSEAEGYALRVSGYTGDAGDALLNGDARLASFLSHNGMRFSTFDRDNDKWAEESCAEMYGGGWWYNNCQSANLNGIYYKGQYDPGSNSPYEIENGVVWVTYKPADYSLKVVRMFIRPAAF